MSTPKADRISLTFEAPRTTATSADSDMSSSSDSESGAVKASVTTGAKADMQVRDQILALLDSCQEAFGGPGGKDSQYYYACDDLRAVKDEVILDLNALISALKMNLSIGLLCSHISSSSIHWPSADAGTDCLNVIFSSARYLLSTLFRCPNVIDFMIWNIPCHTYLLFFSNGSYNNIMAGNRQRIYTLVEMVK
ncbi:hypothetical protein Ddye_014393 [Dipteronia dyeriana]|uniref:Uncharacterized protein n=1 Tax=Dipteronia dyeriana TaxID=168575 RepID=A0AAE0CKI6_9ROSI|nr:hypothetical protein Ddye_014393 [Dipteronia dyeriana]